MTDAASYRDLPAYRRQHATAAQIVISRTSRPGPKHSRVDVSSQTYRTAVALTSALTLRH
jgi:hypothetical protein